MKLVTDAGETVEIGTTETAPTIGIVDYSRRQTDAFGVTTVVERNFSRRMSVRVAVPFDQVDALQRRLAALRATAAQWVADDRFASLSMRGFFKDLEFDLSVPPLSFYRLTVESIADADLPADPGGDPAPAGQTSTLQLLHPFKVAGAGLVSSTVAENDAPAWAAGTSYAKGARVISTATHRIYESLVAGNVGKDPTAAGGSWLDVGPTNRWAMFDEALGTSTSSADSIVVALDAGTATAVALLDVVGATVRVQAIGYDRTLPVDPGALTFLDLPGTASQVTVTIAGTGTKSVGTLLIGRRVALGVTEASPTAGITDHSRKEVDDFGEVTIVERPFAKRMAARALIDTAGIDLVANRIAAVRARPCLWIGRAGSDVLTVYGFFKDFSIEVGPTVSKLSLSIEGLSTAGELKPLGTAVKWPDIADPDGTKPANNADVTGENTSKDTGAVAGVPAATVVDQIATTRDLLDGTIEDVNDLFATYGSSANAADSAAAAATHAANAALASDTANSAKSLAETARTAAQQAVTDATTQTGLATSAKTAAETARNAAQSARDLAQTARGLAETAQTAAETARNAAQSARDTAISERGLAQTANTAAQGAKTAAETAKTAAETAKSDAIAQAQAAGGSANTATTQATNSKNSADASATQATVATTAATGARLTGAALLPSDFSQKGLFFQGTSGGVPGATGAVSDSQFVTVAGVGNVFEIAGTFRMISTVGVFKPLPGRTYELEASVRVLTANTAGGNSGTTIQLVGLNDAYGEISYISGGAAGFKSSQNNHPVMEAFEVWKVRHTVPTTGAPAWMRPRFYSNYNNGSGPSGNQQVQLAYLKITDVTEALAALASATAASTSASTASTKATEAGTSANTAMTKASEAATSAGNAKTSETNAASSESNALGYRNSAQTAQSVSATNAAAAQRAAVAMFPDRYDAAGSPVFTNAVTSAPTVTANVLPSNATATGYGPVRDLTIGTNQTTDLATIEVLPATAGKIYKIEAEVQVIALAGTPNANSNIQLSMRTLDATYAGGGVGQSVGLVTAADANPRVVSWLFSDTAATGRTAWPAGTVWLRPYVRIQSATLTSVTLRVRRLTVTDVTESFNAAASASAAFNSAQTAATSKDAAGESAIAANTAKTAAETARGDALTYRNEAAQARTDAAGSVTTAQQQAGLATSARDEASGYASTASGHAQTATSQAGLAGTSATTAQGHAQTAATQAGNAKTSADSAATSESTALGHRNAAASSASVSATNAKNAGILVGKTVPDPAAWTTASGGAPTSVADMSFAVTTVDGKPSIVVGDNNHFFHKKVIEFAPGRTYEVSAEVEPSTASAASIGLGIWILNGSYGVSQAAAPQYGYVLGQVTNITSRRIATLRFTSDQIIAQSVAPVYLRVAAKGNTTGSNSPRFFSLDIEDITESLKAAGSASAAATSAQTAASSKDAAGESASAASTAKTAAETARGDALTYRNEAVSARDSAQGSANTATTQSGIAVSSANTARLLAANGPILPSTFEDDGTYWAATYQGLPTRASLATTPNAQYTFPTVTGVGKVVQVAATAQNREFAPLGWVKAVAGRTYRISTRVRRTSATAFSMALWGTKINEAGGSGSNTSSSVALTNVDQWYTGTHDVTGDSVLAAGYSYIRPLLWSSAAGTYQIASLGIEDVTSQLAAAGSATAASGFANTASTKADEAGTSASTASGHAQTATTQAGNAKTSSDSAATSASTAQGHANSAAAQSGVSATNAATAMFLDVAHAWDFANSASNGFTGANASLTAQADGLLLTSTANDPVLRTPANLNFAGSRYTRVIVDAQRTAARPSAGTWQAQMYWQIPARLSDSNTYAVVASNRLALDVGVGQRVQLVFDVTTAASTALTEWLTSTIYRLRFDLDDGAATGSAWKIFSIRVVGSDSLAPAKSASAASSSAQTAATARDAAGESANAAATAKTAAETARGDALTYRNEAASSRDAASGSASTAQTQAGLATTARNEASGFANTASGHASTASSRADAAGASAEVASGHANTASTKAGEASTSAGNAAASAATAEGHSNSAATSSTVSASSARLAQIVNSLMFPDRYDGISDPFTTNAGFSPSAATTLASNATVAGYGPVFEATVPTGNASVLTRGVLRNTPGRIYQIEVEFQRTAFTGTPTNTTVMRLFLRNMNGEYVAGGTTVLSSTTFTGSVQTLSAIITGVANDGNYTWDTSAAFFRPEARLVLGGATSLTVQVRRFTITDITESRKSAASASAAFTSETNAATSKKGADEAASAANTSKAAAETARGDALTYRNEAVSARDSAQGSSNTATTQAGLASTSAFNAMVSASVVFPGNFPQDAAQWNTGDQAPTATGSILGHPSYSAGTSTIFWDRAKGSQYQELFTRAFVPRGTGTRTFRFVITARWSTLPTTGTTSISVGLRGAFSNYGLAGWNSTRPNVALTTSMATYTVEATTDGMTSVATQFRPAVLLNTIAGQNGILEIASFSVTEVTESKSAQASASAAFNSASTASTKASEAGTSAETANTARQEAQTARGDALTYRNEAASSRDTATGAASTATTQAGIAADFATGTRPDSAKSYASAASGSAALASSSAAAAQTSATLSAQYGVRGGNLVPNTEWVNGQQGWSHYWNGGPNIVTRDVNGPSGDWYIPGQRVYYARQLGRVGAGDPSYNINSSNIPVSGSSWYQFYIDMMAHRCDVETLVDWFDGNGGYLDTSWSGRAGADSTSGRWPSNYKRFGRMAVQAPSNAAYCRIHARKYDTYNGQPDSYMWLWRAYFGSTREGQAEWNAFQPGPNADVVQGQVATVSQIAGAVADMEGRTRAYLQNTAQAGSQVARLSMYAESSPGVRASGIELAADAVYIGNNRVLEVSNGQVRVNGKVSASDVDLNDGKLTFASGGYRLVEGAAIGPQGNMVMWYGPNSVTPGSETIANSRFALGTDGKVYYGATEISAGGSSRTTVGVGQVITRVLEPGQSATFSASIGIQQATQTSGGNMKAQVLVNNGPVWEGSGAWVGPNEPGFSEIVSGSFANNTGSKQAFAFSVRANSMYGGVYNGAVSWLTVA